MYEKYINIFGKRLWADLKSPLFKKVMQGCVSFENLFRFEIVVIFGQFSSFLPSEFCGVLNFTIFNQLIKWGKRSRTRKLSGPFKVQ